MADYHHLVKELKIPKDARILEIGPLNRPLILKSEHQSVYYCDIRNTQQIKDLYSGNEYLKATGVKVDIDTIVDIDFVLVGGYEATFKAVEKFDYVIASHVLEHVEDILCVLQDIFTILKPDGQFILYYPDKRYCFDHFREEASFRDAYDVFINKRPALARMVLDFFHSAIPESRPYVFWTLEDIPGMLPQANTQEAINLYERALAGELMDDVHYWPFSDSGFIKFMYDATRAELIRYSCKAFYPTQENMQEFVVILQNVGDRWDKHNELQNLRKAYAKAPAGFFNSTYLRQENEISNLQFFLEDARKDAANWRDIRDAMNEDLVKVQKQLIDTQAQLIRAQEQYDAVILQWQIILSHLSEENNDQAQSQLKYEQIHEETLKQMISSLSRLTEIEKTKDVLHQKVLDLESKCDALLVKNTSLQLCADELHAIKSSRGWRMIQSLRRVRAIFSAKRR